MSGFLLLIIGVLLGGGANVAVTEISRYLSRQAVGKALLREIAHCGAKAETLRHWLDEHFLRDVRAGKRLTKQYLHSIDCPFWNACLASPTELPRKPLARLVAYYGFVKSVNRKVQVFEQEEDRLVEVSKQKDPKWAASILRAMARVANTTARMCEQLVKAGNVKELQDLPLEYPSQYETPADLVESKTE